MLEQLALPIIALIIGLIGLVWSADRFVAGAASMATSFGMSKMLVGLTIVSLGTSAPEVIVAIQASLNGSGELAIGNAIGSNIANIGMVLAITALVAPIPLSKSIFKLEFPFLIIITLLAGWLFSDLYLGRTDGFILLALAPVFLYLVAKYSKGHEGDDEIPDYTRGKAALIFTLSLVALIISSDFLIYGAKEIATYMGVSELVIGLTIVAIGTSLPELAASVASALKGQHEIALGNVIGSNIFNLLTVASVPGILAPAAIDPDVFNRDYFTMLLLTVGLALFSFFSLRRKKPRIGRFIGILLLAAYVGYYYWLFA